MNRSKITWIGLGVISLLIRWLLSGYPEIIENVYSRGIFLGVRLFIDYLFAWLPIPLMYILIPVTLYFILRWAVRLWRSSDGWKRKLVDGTISVLAFVGGGIFFFLLLWGYNYSRIPVEAAMEIDPKPLTYEQLWQELERETKTIVALRSLVEGADTLSAISTHINPRKLEKTLRADLKKVLAEYGYPTIGRVRGINLYPKGIFLRFSSSGLYFPYSGEGHIDAGLHPLEKPYVMAHELSHGYGFGDEGSCNFWAYLTCYNSEDVYIRYAGHLSYWRTLAGACLRMDRERYFDFRRQLPKGIQADLDIINETLAKYPDIMPRFRYVAYDAYLKAQGIKEGMKNYSRVIMLVKAWKEKYQ